LPVADQASVRLVAASVSLSLVLVGACAAGAAEMYRWLDAQGRVHFGSEPPKDAREVTAWSPGEGRLKVDPEAAARAAAAGAPTTNSKADPRLAPPLPPPSRTDEQIGGRSEDQWRMQSTTLQRRIHDLEDQLEKLDDSTHAYGGWATHRDGHRVERLEIRDPRPELEKSLKNAEAELETFEDEARQAGVPPGWLR
jgi:hypothetical protein